MNNMLKSPYESIEPSPLDSEYSLAKEAIMKDSTPNTEELVQASEKIKLHKRLIVNATAHLDEREKRIFDSQALQEF